jgi:DNA sulfur modification protein DndD
MAASAGEQQIFAQALISAISDVSKRNFPIMIDTPLGRLDDQHRFGVLKYFTDRPGQVILLSTDTEVVGPYLDVIKPRLAATYYIRHEHDGDIGRSYIERGYFPETRA